MTKPRCAFVVGGTDSFNTYRTLASIGVMLEDRFELDLVTTSEDLATRLSDCYAVHGTGKPSGIAGEAKALRDYFAETTPDVVSNLIGAPRYGNMIAGLKPSESAYVCRFSGENFRTVNVVSRRRKPAIFLFRNVLGRVPLYTADHFVTMGPRGKRSLVDRGVERERVSILPPPVEPERVCNSVDSPPFDTAHDRNVAVFVGRVSRLKGVRTLERAIPEVLDRRDDMQFVIIGQREDSLSIPSRHADRVDLVGPVDPDRIPACLDAADLLVHPSLTEGVSRAVVEALLSGTPVIARDVGDLAFATNNIFTTDDEFPNMICEWEDLALDDARKFTPDALEDRYVRTFANLL